MLRAILQSAQAAALLHAMAQLHPLALTPTLRKAWQATHAEAVALLLPGFRTIRAELAEPEARTELLRCAPAHSPVYPYPHPHPHPHPHPNPNPNLNPHPHPHPNPNPNCRLCLTLQFNGFSAGLFLHQVRARVRVRVRVRVRGYP